MKEEMDSNTMIVEEFNVPFSTIVRSSRQNISRETLDLNYALLQMNLTDTT